MLRRHLRLIIPFGVVCLITIAETSHAVPINYGDIAGTTVTFLQVTEDSPSGESLPLFGSPILTGDSLDFNPVNYLASSNAGSADLTDGTLVFMAEAMPQNAILQITLLESGDVALAGFGTDATSGGVASLSAVSIIEVDGSPITPIPLFDVMNIAPSAGNFRLGTDGGGGPSFNTAWSGQLTFDIDVAMTNSGLSYSLGATKLSVTVDNILAATSEPSTIALISKKDFGVAVLTNGMGSNHEIATLLGSGTWTDNIVWSSDLYPDNGNGGKTYDVVLTPGTVTIPFLTDIVVQDLTIGGSIVCDGSLTVLGDATWNIGNISGLGTVQLTGATAINVIGGGGTVSLAGILTNSGVIQWQGGQVGLAQSGGLDAELHNAGTIDLLDDGTAFATISGSPILVNELTGTLRRSGGGGSAAILDVATLNYGRVELNQAEIQFPRGLTNAVTGVIDGTGTLGGDIVNSGRVAPGHSPGTLEIDGDYAQGITGALEIEVGGLEAGTEHDQLLVSGSASLGGRLEVPIIDGFVPTENQSITFLSAGAVSGVFAALFSPNLAEVNPNVAMRVVYGAQDVQLQFVAPSSAIQFDTESSVADWANDGTWTNGAVPGTSHIINVQNVPGVDQRVDVQTANAFTHQLSVSGNLETENTITVGVNAGLSLSAIGGVTIGNQGIIELNGGNLVSGGISVQGGGTLAGNGTVVGRLAVGAAAGPAEALLSPGIGPGHLEVIGSYEQGEGGTLLVDIDGLVPGQFDTINVTGTATFGGMLRIDATNLDPAPAGTTFAILTAGDITDETAFESVETVGNDEIFFAPIYPAASGSGQFVGGGSVTPDASLLVGQYYKGDMDRDGIYDEEDVQAFALALTRPLAYRSLYGIFGHQSGDLDGFGTGNYQPNGRLDFDDIDEFALLMSGSGATLDSIRAAIDAQRSVPEPSTALSILIGGILTAARSRRRPRRDYLFRS